jgi:hypothetical protein
LNAPSIDPIMFDYNVAVSVGGLLITSVCSVGFMTVYNCP